VGIARSTVYADKTAVVDEVELLLLRLLDEEYTRHPFYGTRLMRTLGLVAMAPGPNTSKKHPQNKVYPYRVRRW